MSNNSTVLYAPVTAVRAKATKVVILRAKSLAFKAVSAERTAQLVANATGFEPLFRNSCEGSMYQ